MVIADAMFLLLGENPLRLSGQKDVSTGCIPKRVIQTFPSPKVEQLLDTSEASYEAPYFCH